ncbi:MAG TPA: DNA-processing protein DprA, partial [Fimbriimonadaceae bacterium]|nr:DNA-processing protein DprA [Fimbriimonadaceae bacterium]
AVGTGTVVGVLAESLLKEAGRKDYREAIMEGRMCLMSEVHPEARFDVGNAMARNRLAYACADAALVVECDPHKGGTWAGAMDALKEGKAVYVIQGAKAERELSKHGAIRVPLTFALEPEKLIARERPEAPVPVVQHLVTAVRETFGNPARPRDELVSLVREQPEAFVDKLMAAAISDGIIEPTLVLNGSALTEKRKPRSRANKADATLFDEAQTREQK